MGAADDGRGQKADGVIAIEERIVIARAIAIEVAKAVGVIGPARVARADKKRRAGISAKTAHAEARRRMAIAIEKGIIIAGAEKRAESCCTEEKILFHINHGTRERGNYSKSLLVPEKSFEGMGRGRKNFSFRACQEASVRSNSPSRAGMAELVDALGLGSSGFICAGSSPVPGTSQKKKAHQHGELFCVMRTVFLSRPM
ncbi:MAG: hypothetical protein RL117_558 [Verrucomicrobiota bacterium]